MLRASASSDGALPALSPAEAEDRNRLFGDVIRALSLALDLDEGVKLFHAWRVGLLAHRIGRVLDPPLAGRLYLAGLLHDIGGIGLKDHVIHHAAAPEPSPDALRHVREGVRILEPFEPLQALVPILADHHERFDGTGYPRGKRGSEISLAAGVLRLSDEFDVRLRGAPSATRSALVEALLREAPARLCAPEVAEGARRALAAEPELPHVLFEREPLREQVRQVNVLPPELAHLEPLELLSQLLWLFARIIDAKHAYTSGHSQRVAFYGLRIADALGSQEFNRWDLLWAGLLHDVGKVGVPRRLLEKPGQLGREERLVLRRHADDTVEIIRTIGALAALAYPAAAHHEWYDGSGYPRGTAGEEIPLIGRILAFADAYDAMTSDRAHRRGLPHREAIARIRAALGTQFDPSLADAALEALDGAGGLPPSLPRDVSEFHAFFDTQRFEQRTFHGRPAARSQLVKPVGRGVLLLDLEPWQEAALDDALGVESGGDLLARELGVEPRPGLGQHLDEASAELLERMVAELEEAPASTRYLFTAAGRPVEAVLQRRGAGFALLYRTAENRLQTLKRMAVFYRNFVASSEAVCFTDPSGRILDVNRTWLDLSRAKLKDAVGCSLTDVVRGETGGEVGWSPAEASRGSADWAAEVRLRSGRHGDVPVQLQVSAIRDVRGELVGFVAHGLDIRERKLAEERIRTLHRCLAGLGADYRTNVARILETAASGLRATAAWYQRADLPAAAPVASWGLPPLAQVPLLGPSAPGREPRSAWISSGEELRRRLEGAGPSAEWITGAEAVLQQPVAWRDGGTGALGLVLPPGSALGDGERDFLGTLAGALATEEDRRLGTEALERLSRLKSDLIAVTSHDLKSPVSAMLSYVNLMRDHLPELSEAETRRYLARITSSGQKLLRLIGDILDVERLEAGLLELRPAPTRLEELVRSTVELHEPIAESRRLALRGEILGRCPKLLLDADQIERLLGNLVSNAIKFCPEEGRVTVTLDARDGAAVRISVTDTGPGIPEEELEAVFDRYYQARHRGAVSSRGFGAGLGLAIVRGIAQLHGGRVWAENRASGGACFTLELPRGDQLAEAPPAVLLIGPADGPTASLAHAFAAAGLEVLRAADGAVAKEVAAGRALDALLVDGAAVDPELLLLSRALGALSPAPPRVAVSQDARERPPGFTHVLSPPVLDTEVQQLLREVRLLRRSRARRGAGERHA